jgi:PAS domain S-box-containing protein
VSQDTWWIIAFVSLVVAEALLIIGLVVNLVMRRRAEKALRESEDLHKVILSNISDTVFLTNNQGNFTFVCPNVHTIFGYSYDEAWALGHITRLLGRNHFVPDEAELLEEIRNVEHKVSAKCGTPHTLLVSIKPVAIREGTLLYVCRDITDLAKSRARIDDLAGRLINAQEQERRSIARELHDDLNQQVAAMGIELSILKGQLSFADRRILDRISTLQVRVEALCGWIRQLSHSLHSATLEHLGLKAALRGFCKEYTEREGITVNLRITEEVQTVSSDAALCLYRVTQEALHNVAKHSGAKSAQVSLTGSVDFLELHVTDSGRGFDIGQRAAGKGLGLASMEERIKLLHGTMVLKTEPGAGTELMAKIPLDVVAT